MKYEDTEQEDIEIKQYEESEEEKPKKRTRKPIVVSDEDDDEDESITLKSILGGDILQSKKIVRQIRYIVFLVFLLLVYTGNRYAGQQDAIAIKQLQEKLRDVRNKTTTISAELTNMTRQSSIEKALKEYGDSTLVNATSPRYNINVDQGNVTTEENNENQTPEVQ